MPLSNKLRADYAELINEQLDNIPINSSKDFDAIVIGLSSIIYPKAKEKYVIDKDLQETVANIAEYLDKDNATSIMCYVEERYYPEYLEIIKKRIKKKITEFEKMSKKAKEKYINEQQKRKSQAKKHQAELARHSPPEEGSEAHTITHQQWLANEQNLFQDEQNIFWNENQQVLARHRNSLDELFSSYDITREELDIFIARLQPEKFEMLLNNTYAFHILIDCVTIEQFESLNTNVLSELLTNCDSFVSSITIRINDILSFPSDFQLQIISNINSVSYLIGAGISLQRLSGYNYGRQRQLCANGCAFADLIKAGISLEYIFNLDSELRKKLLDNSSAVKILIEAGVDLDTLNRIESIFGEELSRNSYAIGELIKAGESIENIFDIEKSLRVELFAGSNYYRYANLIKAGISLAEIFKIDPIVRKELLNKSRAAAELIKNRNGILLGDLIALKTDVRKCFLKNSKEVIELLENGICLEYLINLKPTIREALIRYACYAYEFARLYSNGISIESIFNLNTNMDCELAPLYLDDYSEIGISKDILRLSLNEGIIIYKIRKRDTSIVEGKITANDKDLGDLVIPVELNLKDKIFKENLLKITAKRLHTSTMMDIILYNSNIVIELMRDANITLDELATINVKTLDKFFKDYSYVFKKIERYYKEKKYIFSLMSGRDVATRNEILFELQNGIIRYRANGFRQGEIMQEDLGKNKHLFPDSEDLEKFEAIRENILLITANKGHTDISFKQLPYLSDDAYKKHLDTLDKLDKFSNRQMIELRQLLNRNPILKKKFAGYFKEYLNNLAKLRKEAMDKRKTKLAKPKGLIYRKKAIEEKKRKEEKRNIKSRKK